jgi:Flp pilus assembly secretin CpaC
MRLLPLKTRVTPFIIVRGAGESGTSIYDSPRPTLSGEDAELTEKLHAVTGIRTVYLARTGQNTLAMYGTVRDRSEYDTVRRYTLLLPQKKTDTSTSERGASGAAIEQYTEPDRTQNFIEAGLGFNRGVQMFVRILDPNEAVLRKVTIESNVVEINRTAMKNLGVEYGSATLLNETITPSTTTIQPPVINNGTVITPELIITNPGSVTRQNDPAFVQGSTIAGNTFGGFGGFSNINPFRARLNALYTRGNARILSSPNLTALNGATAQIVVGGSRPIPSAVGSQGGVGTGIEFRRYGIILTMRPTLTDDDTILLQIRADVTNIDPTTAISFGGATVPGETVRSIDTTLNVREGDIIVMGGLITNEQLKRTSRVPILSQIPVLGALFQSKRFENNETELAIFMSPTITRSPISREGYNAAEKVIGAPVLPGNRDGGTTATLITNPAR